MAKTTVAVAAVLASLSLAHAGPLGPLWRVKLAKAKHGGECPSLIPVPGALASTDYRGTVTLYDRVTAARSQIAMPALGAAGKSVYVSRGTGDTLLVAYEFKIVAGVDAKTGALRWRRDLDAAIKNGMIEAHPIGGDALVLAKNHDTGTHTLERVDAATGTSRWKAPITTKHKELTGIEVGATRAFVIVQDRGDHGGATIVAFDRDGKQTWSVDDEVDALFGWSTSGDDLVYIRDNRIHVYAGATGKRSDWQVNWNSGPVVFGDTLYATPVDHTVEAYTLAGKPRWTVKLADRVGAEFRDPRVVAAADGKVLVHDQDTLRVLDAATGAVESSYGIGAANRSHIVARDGGPAVTYCTDKELVALDPSAGGDEHRVKITGRIHCRNCTKETELVVRAGDAVVSIGRRRRFSLEVSWRGTLDVSIRDATFSSGAVVKTIEVTADRTLDLGEVGVTVPEMGPGED